MQRPRVDRSQNLIRSSSLPALKAPPGRHTAARPRGPEPRHNDQSGTCGSSTLLACRRNASGPAIAEPQAVDRPASASSIVKEHNAPDPPGVHATTARANRKCYHAQRLCQAASFENFRKLSAPSSAELCPDSFEPASGSRVATLSPVRVAGQTGSPHRTSAGGQRATPEPERFLPTTLSPCAQGASCRPPEFF
jgi:hypothetical protein